MSIVMHEEKRTSMYKYCTAIMTLYSYLYLLQFYAQVLYTTTQVSTHKPQLNLARRIQLIVPV
jgi:hypothetical protein